MDQILGYQLEGLLGKGSFSEVYKGRKGEKTAAIKLMSPQSAINPETILSSLRYEFWVLKDLVHPNIVRLFDFGRLSRIDQLDDGRIFLIEELLEGEMLDQFCKNRPFAECEPVFIGCLQGLQELDRWHIVHGDLKPANILVQNPPQPPFDKGGGGGISKLLDFGLARAERISAGTVAPSGGTPATMAPEVIVNRPSDHRSDLYSLGVSFYAALTGKNPFVGETTDETCQAHLQKVPEPIGILKNDIPPRWAELIHRMLLKNPADRPQSALKALSLVTKESFVLAPTAFVGRRKAIDHALSILLNRKGEEKIAIVVHGSSGIGVSRFLRELFYQVIGQRPELRNSISLVERDPCPETDLLLIDRLKSPQTHRVEKITLEPFTRAELIEWLSLVFDLRGIPGAFADHLLGLSKGKPPSGKPPSGNPGAVWSLLTRLSEKNLLADASGRVTASSLLLIDWDRLLPGVKENFEDSFEWVFGEIERKVHRRQIREGDPLWAKLFKLTADIRDGAERLKKRALALSLQGEAAIDEGKWERAREVLNSALEIFRNDPSFQVEEIRTRNFLAYIQLRQGRIAEAVYAFEACRDEMRQKLSAADARKITNLDLGFAYLQAGDYQKAAGRLEEEIKEAGPSKETAISYNLAQSWAGMGDTARAEEYFRKTLKAARANRDPAFILRALNGLGNVLRDSEQWKKALDFYGEALEVALAINDLGSAAAASQNRGALCASKGLHDEAVRDLEDSLKYAGKIAVHYAYEKRLICRSYVELGEIAVSRGRPGEAIDPLDRAWHLAEADEDLKNFRFWVLLARARAWRALKDEGALKRELARLNFYADDKEKRKQANEFLQSITKQAGPDETKVEPVFAPELLRSAYKSDSPVRMKRAGEDQPDMQTSVEALLTINRDLVGDLPLDDLLGRILSHAIELSGAELGVLLSADEKGELIPRLSLNAALSPELSEISLSVAGRVLETGKTVRSADAKSDEQFNQYASVIALNLRSIVGLPISFRGKLLGVLYLSHRYRQGIFDDRLTRTLEAFADQAGLALTNHQLLEFHRRAQEKLKADLETSQVDLKRTRERLRSLPEKIQFQLTDRPMLTQSAVILELLKSVDRLAESAVSVIINGETGTGKELLARYIHENSPRRQKPFVAINCGALPANLIESELFGHVRGAFTGADRDKVGLIEAADGGTLFLDEIGDLPPDLQVKLLRVLQEREVLRVGDRKGKPVEVRVICASHKNLREAMEAKKFREDLYYRLAGFEVTLPPLRERPEDIPLLAEHFLREYRREMKRKTPERIGGPLMKILEEYAWPGNVRELKNFVATSAALCEKAILNVDSIPGYLRERIEGRGAGRGVMHYAPTASPTAWYRPGLSWADHEQLIFASALIAFDFNVPRVASSLGISVATVYKWMRESRIRESAAEWQKKILPYPEGTPLAQIRKNVFARVAEKYPRQPYKAARELSVAPMTFYRWSK